MNLSISTASSSTRRPIRTVLSNPLRINARTVHCEILSNFAVCITSSKLSIRSLSYSITSLFIRRMKQHVCDNQQKRKADELHFEPRFVGGGTNCQFSKE